MFKENLKYENNKINKKIKKYFDIFLNFIFFKEKIDLEKITNSTKNKVLFDKKKFSVFLLSYGNYEVRKSIKSLKFHNNKQLSKFFGILLFDNISDILLDLDQFYNFKKPVLLNIPISKKRLKKRKYNQNDLIIKNFMNTGGYNFVKWEKNNLIKIKETIPQSHLKTKYERLFNPKNSFKLKKPENIKGNNIIIFDDIYTTGATINEAKKIIKKAGAKRILIITIAR